MRVDGRRLVRAFGVAAALFLLVGSGAGLVLAATGDDAGALQVPAPRPGDRAGGTATEVVLDAAKAKGGPGFILLDKAVFEWLPERQVQDQGFRWRLSHPLRAEYVFAEGEAFENHEVQVVDYDAATGQPIVRSSTDASSWCKATYVAVNCSGPTAVTVREDYRTDRYTGELGPCGMAASLQGRVHSGGPIDVPGACGWPGSAQATAYEPAGWQEANATLGLGRRFAFAQPGDAGLGLDYDGLSPFPARASQPMADYLNDAYTWGRFWDLRRAEVRHGTGAYTPVDADAVNTPEDPVPLTARTPWLIDDDGIGLPLPLPEAYAAALAEPDPLPTQATRQASAGRWLDAHPHAYMPFAFRLETVDRHGQRNPSWLLLWVEGDDWLGKQVFDRPAGADGLTLPESMGRQVTVEDWTPGWLPADRSTYFPRADQLPDAVPDVGELMARYRAGNPDRPANRYGFEMWCRGQGCAEVVFYVEAGSHAESQEDTVSPFLAGLGTATTALEKLRVDRDGRQMLRTSYLESEKGVLSPEPAPSAPGPDSGLAKASAGVWVVPAAPAAATGISLLALLGGLVYYFWPAAKGAGFGLFSRIRHDDVLDHPVRRRIADAVESEPGIHFLALSRKADAGRSALEHHLRKLLAAGLVVKRQAPGYTCYFPKGKVDRHLMGAAPSLRSDGSRAVLQAIAASPGASSREIAASLGLAPSTVSYHLKRLEAAGLVAPGARSGVRLTELGSQASGGGVAAGAAA